MLNKDKEMMVCEEDSEDQGLHIGELVSSDGSRLSFGSFQDNEITNQWKLQINWNKSVVINEYGSNLHKNKNDPLVITEAKLALQSGIIPTNEKALELLMGQGRTEQFMEQDQQQGDQSHEASPGTGTQEPPAVDLSSQEDGITATQSVEASGDKTSCSIWGLTEEESIEDERLEHGSNEDKEENLDSNANVRVET
ncbi:unnamed protein product [Urochloa humidicola]